MRGNPRLVIGSLVALCLLWTGAAPSQAAVTKPAQPKTPAVTAGADWVKATFNPVQGADSYRVRLYPALGKSAVVTQSVTSSPYEYSFTGLSFCTSYRVSVQAFSGSVASVESGKAPVTTSCNAGLTPTFGTPTPTADGFTVSITNYDAAYTWSGTATASGTVAISSEGLVTVTGVAASTSSTATIVTSRTGYTSGSATVSATSLGLTLTSWIGAGTAGSPRDFTIEFWFKPYVDPVTGAGFFSGGRQEIFALTGDGNGRFDVWYTAPNWSIYSEAGPGQSPAGTGQLNFNDGSTDGPVPALGVWTHVAVTRSGGVLRFFLNGVKGYEGANAQNLSGLNVLLLCSDPNTVIGAGNRGEGYLSNVRIVDGTALYTAAFTPPTSKLTAVTGTTFLLNDALKDATAGSVLADGSLYYQQVINTDTSAVGDFTAQGGESVSVQKRGDSPFAGP